MSNLARIAIESPRAKPSGLMTISVRSIIGIPLSLVSAFCAKGGEVFRMPDLLTLSESTWEAHPSQWQA